MPANSYFIHPSAIIDEGATIGNGTFIWHFCHVMPGAVIGSNCLIGQNCFVDNNARIGNRVKIQNNVSVYNSVTIEDDVFVGPSVVFTNVINPRSFIDRKEEFKITILHKGCTIGANATIICGNAIGEFAMIGAGAVITKNVLPYEIVTGNAASVRGWVSKAGKKLLFDKDGKAICPLSKEVYTLNNNKVTCL